jgi:hypothetical protein
MIAKNNFPNSRINDDNWITLLDQIQQRNVVPIIGNELFEIEINGRIIKLEDFLTEKLAEIIDFDYYPEMTISEIVENRNWNENNINPYRRIFEILSNVNIKVPEIINTLFSRFKFDLILTTDIYNIVEKAIIQIWKQEPISLGFSNKKNSYETLRDDLDVDRKIVSPTVYHVFGKINKVGGKGSFVLTEDDLLLFTKGWFNDSTRPQRISDYLNEKYLMVIGSKYPNWMFRFFWHSMQPSPSHEVYGFVGSEVCKDCNLVKFLARKHTVYIEDAQEFVDELCAKSFDFTKEDYAPIFISYASEDIDTVKCIYDICKKNNLNIWFDKKKLEGGTDYEKEIMKRIEECKFFVPIISKNTIDESDNGRFFRKEWRKAMDEAEKKGFNKNYIIPICIDTIDKLLIPEKISKKHILHYTDDTFENQLITILQNF